VAESSWAKHKEDSRRCPLLLILLFQSLLGGHIADGFAIAACANGAFVADIGMGGVGADTTSISPPPGGGTGTEEIVGMGGDTGGMIGNIGAGG